jgi:hypothetical protein
MAALPLELARLFEADLPSDPKKFGLPVFEFDRLVELGTPGGVSPGVGPSPDAGNAVLPLQYNHPWDHQESFGFNFTGAAGGAPSPNVESLALPSGEPLFSNGLAPNIPNSLTASAQNPLQESFGLNPDHAYPLPVGGQDWDLLV